MVDQTSPRVGIIAESMADIYALRSIVTEAGLQIGTTLEFPRWKVEQALPIGIDAWIVNLDVEKLEEECPEKLDALMDSIAGIMILCEGSTPPTHVVAEYQNWKRRLLNKIQDIRGAMNLSHNFLGAPERVWVLAGSIGGPDAIRVFLENLPPNLGIAFVYANHLQADFEQTLANAVGKHTHYAAYVPKHGDVLVTNRVAVISPEFTTSIKANGTIHVAKERWSGQYKPNLDHVISSVAQAFGHTGGVIVFSGMCDDSAAACRIMKQNNGKVWAQEPKSCVSSAMPEAALATGCVDKIGTPEELAKHLVSWVNGLNQKVVNQ